MAIIMNSGLGVIQGIKVIESGTSRYSVNTTFYRSFIICNYSSLMYRFRDI